MATLGEDFRSRFGLLFTPDAPAAAGGGGGGGGSVGGDGHRGAVKRKPWWLRAIMIQEVGLIVVIALMVLGLTLATDNISRPEFQQVPRGQTATVTADAVTYTNAAGEAVRLARADGWVLVQRGVMQRVERKEIVPIPAGGSAETVTDAQGTPTGFVVGGKTYLTASGWSIGQVPEAWGGGTQLQRDPQVNKFLNRDNLMIVLTSASFYAIMAVGLTAIIVLGGIDLSVGAIYALAAVCGAYVLSSMQAGAAAAGQEVGTGLALVIGIGVCCLVGLACGLLNGAASVGLGVHPFIITLGGMGVYRGLAFVTTGGLSIGDLPKGYGETVRHRIGGIEWVPASVMVVIGLLGALVFSRTVFGRRVFAIGGNETAAKYAGVPVGRTKIVVFMLAGLLAGLAAAIALGKYGSASSADGRGYELEVIAAAVVGGASLAGGRGSAMGAILGAIIIQLINNGFESLGIDSNYKQIVIGLSIVLAVLVDQTKNRLGGPRKH